MGLKLPKPECEITAITDSRDSSSSESRTTGPKFSRSRVARHRIVAITPLFWLKSTSFRISRACGTEAWRVTHDEQVGVFARAGCSLGIALGALSPALTSLNGGGAHSAAA